MKYAVVITGAKLKAQQKIKRPPFYKVIILNDDYTPMPFVVYVLQRFFGLNLQIAAQIMLQVHIEGKGMCGVFTREIAETKVIEVNNFSRCYDYPLLCCMEPCQ